MGLEELGQDVNELKEEIRNIRDCVCKIASNNETNQKPMMEGV